MLIAAYGTLRGGQHSAKYLTDKYGLDSVKEVETKTIDGYALYHGPRYGFDCPFAIKQEGKKITVTVLDISDNGAAADIDRGESWGYDKTPITDNVFMYVAKPEQAKDPILREVVTGDWLNRELGGS